MKTQSGFGAWRSNARRRFGVAVASLALTATVLAHDTWILPERARVKPGEEISLDLTSGMAFPANEVAVKPDWLARASLRLAGRLSDLRAGTPGKTALQIRTLLRRPGIATVWIESKPRALELTPAQVREYLEEIGAWGTIGKKWEAEGSSRWRETYTKHAKSFVWVGDPAGDDSWREPVGMAFEIVPEKDPTAILNGEELSVRLLNDGKPLSDFPVGLLAASQKSGLLQRTDAEGRMRARLDRTGWWLVRATLLERSSPPRTDWQSRFTTLTVFVRPR